MVLFSPLTGALDSLPPDSVMSLHVSFVEGDVFFESLLVGIKGESLTF